jgi:hypothetical protein
VYAPGQGRRAAFGTLRPGVRPGLCSKDGGHHHGPQRHHGAGAPPDARGPVLRHWDEWLRPVPVSPSWLRELLQSPPQDFLICHMVSTAVNSARNESPELVAPVRPPELTPPPSSWFSTDASLRLPAL